MTAALSRVVPASDRGPHTDVQPTSDGGVRAVFSRWDGPAFAGDGLASVCLTAVGILDLESSGLSVGVERRAPLPE
jgi:hypothetical protein